MKRFVPLISLLLCLSLLAGCASAASTEKEQGEFTFTDDLGRTVSLNRPERVAALIGSFADIWLLSGGEESLVGAAEDAWTSLALDLDESVQCTGTVKNPSLEAVLAMEPDLVLASANTVSDVALRESMESAGLTVAYFDVQCFEDYLRMLRVCCTINGNEAAWEQYGEAVQSEVETALARQDGSAPRVLCLRATSASCHAKGSTDNLLGEMVASMGCRNVADSEGSALEELSMEAILEADPDYIFAVLHGNDTEASRSSLEKSLLQNPAWSSLRAVQEGHFYILEQELYNFKPNERWGEAYEKLADILYPE